MRPTRRVHLTGITLCAGCVEKPQDRPNACERPLNGCRQTVVYDHGAQHPSQMFLTGSRFLEREENRSTRRKILQSGWDRLKLSSLTIAEVGGAYVKHNPNLTSLGIHHRNTRMAAQQDSTFVMKWEPASSLGQTVPKICHELNETCRKPSVWSN